MRPAAKSLILDLLSTVRGAAMPVRALIGAAALFRISSNSVRVELARLGARGLVARDRRGRYRIAPSAAPVQEHVASWTHLEDRIVPWTGAWIGASTGHLSGAPRQAVRRRVRAFEFLGFRELERGFWIRPENLSGGVGAVRERLSRLGGEPAAIVFAITEMDAATDARARRLWDTAALRKAYRATRRRLAVSARRLPAVSPARAMVETFILGGRAIHQLVYDPLLPEPIVPAAERRALVDITRRYDRLGRDCWSRFMRGHGAPARRAPTGVRIATTPAAAIAAGSSPRSA